MQIPTKSKLQSSAFEFEKVITIERPKNHPCSRALRKLQGILNWSRDETFSHIGINLARSRHVARFHHATSLVAASHFLSWHGQTFWHGVPMPVLWASTTSSFAQNPPSWPSFPATLVSFPLSFNRNS